MIIKKTGLEAAPPFPTSPTVVGMVLVLTHDKFRFSPMVNSQEDSIANGERLLPEDWQFPSAHTTEDCHATLVSSRLPLVHVITRDLIGNRFSFGRSVRSTE